MTFRQFLSENSKAVEIAHGWREHLWNRAGMSKLAQSAKKDGELHHLHPGPMTVYRGVNKGSQHHGKAGTSWTKSKSVAKKYADGGKVHALDIDHHTPAIDVNKILKGVSSKSSKDKEVFLAKGNYKPRTEKA